MVFMSVQSLIFALLLLPLNISADIWDARLLLPLALIIMMVKMSLFTTPGTKITKLSLNVFLWWISFPALSAISRKNSLKCYATTASMPDSTNKVQNYSDVCPLKKKHFSDDIWTGVILSFWPLVMTRFAVRNVTLLWWFWKCTTKKLHYLNDTERSWDMDKSIPTILFLTVK